jgi:drug/metabolite transporter (DMT)-like permease
VTRRPGVGVRPRDASLAAAILLTIIWGTTWAAVRIGVEGIPPLTGVALRFLIAGTLLYVIGRARGVVFGRAPHEKFLWVTNGLLSFVASYVIIYWAEQYVPSGLGSVLWATFPLILALLAHRWLPGERLHAAKLGGILLGFAGIAVIYSEDFSTLGGPMVLVGSVVMLLSPAASAVSNVLVKRRGAAVHPLSISAIPMLISAGVTGLMALVFERDRPVVFDATSVGALLYLAVFGSAVTFGLFYWLLARHSATRLSMIAYGSPLIAVVVGTFFLDEPLTPRLAAGALLVLLGVFLAVRARRPG